MDHWQVYCEIGGERSEGQKTGLELSPGLLTVREDGGRESVSVLVHTPPQCAHCSLELGVSVRNNCRLQSIPGGPGDGDSSAQL